MRLGNVKVLARLVPSKERALRVRPPQELKIGKNTKGWELGSVIKKGENNK